jgi:hypothetical protein
LPQKILFLNTTVPPPKKKKKKKKNKSHCGALNFDGGTVGSGLAGIDKKKKMSGLKMVTREHRLKTQHCRKLPLGAIVERAIRNQNNT